MADHLRPRCEKSLSISSRSDAKVQSSNGSTAASVCVISTGAKTSPYPSDRPLDRLILSRDTSIHMIIIDTKVWSETLRAEPNSTVLSWLRANATEAALTVVSVFEMRYGASLLPRGPRRSDLESQIERLCSEMTTRTLNYDSNSASEHASFAAFARTNGRALSREDGQILGIAAAHGCRIATRNVRDFEGFGIQVLDPWRD